jgi:hypothetical protein
VHKRAAKEAEPLLATLWESLPAADATKIERFLKRVHAVFARGAAQGDGRNTNGSARRPAGNPKSSAN